MVFPQVNFCAFPLFCNLCTSLGDTITFFVFFLIVPTISGARKGLGGAYPLGDYYSPLVCDGGDVIHWFAGFGDSWATGATFGGYISSPIGVLIWGHCFKPLTQRGILESPLFYQHFWGAFFTRALPLGGFVILWEQQVVFWGSNIPDNVCTRGQKV